MKFSNLFDIQNWILGFTDGEGCFCISFTKRSKLKLKIETHCSFSISQKACSLKILEQIQQYFSCGGIRYSKKDDTYKYEIRNIKDLNKKVIPFFTKYPLLTKKRKDFEIFSIICKKVFKKLHLNVVELKNIIELAYQMNETRTSTGKFSKRKYSKEKLLSFMNKLKV